MNYQGKLSHNEEWTEIDTICYSYRNAAEHFAEFLDKDSGGDLFEDPRSDKLSIDIKNERNETKTFDVSFEYQKVFYVDFPMKQENSND